MNDNPLNLIKRMYRAVEMGETPSETARARGRRTHFQTARLMLQLLLFSTQLFFEKIHIFVS